MKIEKVYKVVANLHDKTWQNIIHINLKQTLCHWLVLKKNHRVITFNQNALLKSYIDLNSDLRKKAKNHFKKDFLKMMNKPFLEKLWKMWENIKILNLSQQKEEETIWCQNQMIILQGFSQKNNEQ